MTTDHKAILSQCQYWIEQVIIKWSICPFAKKVWQTDDIDYQIVESADMEDQVLAVMGQIQLMKAQNSPDTALLILPNGCEAFDDYLLLVDICNELLAQQDELSFVQLASFHPDYLFAEEPEQSASHFTNRAPWPIIHLIRQASIAKVLEQFPEPESIPVRNIELMQQIGYDELARQLEAIQQLTD